MLSIIIPSLNDSKALKGTLTSIRSRRLKTELILADGGSTDRTKEIAFSHGAKLIDAKLGRGSQLAAGAKIAKGNWFLFLHADTRPGRGWETAIKRFIEKPENRFKAGYFIFKLDHDSDQAKILEKLVAVRCKLFSLPYGDQGLLISKDFYRVVGGYEPIPIMEDIEILRTIKSSRLKQLPIVAITSARRYKYDGYIKRSLQNSFCLLLFYLGVAPNLLVKLYNK